eukprot:8061822-Alexandrium_andersonii.AAC.1
MMPGRRWRLAETGTDPRRPHRTGRTPEIGPTIASPQGTRSWGRHRLWASPEPYRTCWPGPRRTWSAEPGRAANRTVR